jgi:hypothetical protein
MFRRRRRSANLRYHPPRFDNRTRHQGWLPPSLQSRIGNVASWLNWYRKLAPITAIKVESIRFDMQALENPDIEGLEYQRGTLFGDGTLGVPPGEMGAKVRGLRRRRPASGSVCFGGFRLLEECRRKKEALNPNSRRITIDLEHAHPSWQLVQIPVAEFYETARAAFRS